MTIRANAPIATTEDRNALSWIVARIRPDWDRKGIESALAKHPCQELDVLAAQAVNAAATRADQRTPACLGLDGEHTNRARVSLGAPVSVTAKMPGYAAIEPECGYPDCGVRRDKHLAHIIPAEIPAHEWEQPRPIARASSEQIRAAKSAALSTKESTDE